MDFSKLTFGTAGIRSIMGEKENELNSCTIMAISHCYGEVLKTKTQEGSIVICYDSRKNGKEFASLAAGVLSSYGYEIKLAKDPAPTPFLSFAMRSLNAIGGINITASHNPKEYNGYKVYDIGGIQIDVDFAEQVQETLKRYTEKDYLENAKKIQTISPTVYQEYINTIEKNHGLKKKNYGDFSATYTPLHGSAGQLVRALKNAANLPLTFVEEQMAPDGSFPQAPEPNPDNEKVFTSAISYGGDLLLANDPDGDRIGAMVKTEKGYTLLSGNEIGILLLYYRLTHSGDIKGKYAVKSLVSATLATKIAAAFFVECKDTLVGFRYIGQKINEDPENFLFGFEESGGYLAYPHARDKDGIEAAALLVKAGADYKKEGKTLVDLLDHIYKTYGYGLDRTYSLTIPLEQSKKIMASLRRNPPQEIHGQKVLKCKDFLEESKENFGDILLFSMEKQRVIFRPSGTEPKMKIYLSAEGEDLSHAKKEIEALFTAVKEQIHIK